MLWVDKHRPTSLDKLDYHKDQAAQLKELAKAGDLPHMLFYGPSGAGKKTRIMCLLREIFGAGVERVKLEHRPFKTPSGKVIEMTTVASAYHIEINPGDAGNADRYVVQEVIKEMAQYNPVGGEAARAWKVLLLSEVDRLSKEAQAALRRTMEKYTATCRLILVATSPSKVIEPLRSRCLGVRVPLPQNPELMGVLQAVAKKEGVTLPQPIAARISQAAGRNVRRAILMLEATKVANPSLGAPAAAGGGVPPPPPANVVIPSMDWERYIGLLANDVLREQSPRSLLAARSKIYELLVNCIPGDVIVRKLSWVLTGEPPGKALPDALKFEIVHWCAHYEHRLALGSGGKEMFHIEALVAKLMSVLKTAGWTPPPPGAAGGSVSR